MPGRIGDLLIAAAFLLVGLAFLVLSFRIPEPAATLFPRLLLAGVLTGSGVYLVTTLRGRPASKIGRVEEGIDPAHLMGVLGLALIYIPAMSLAGYVAATAVFIVVGIYLLGYRRLTVVVPLALLVTLFVFVVFKTLMYASLPSSALDNWLTEAMYRYVLT